MRRLKIAVISLFCAALVIVCSGSVTLVFPDPRSSSWYLVQTMSAGSSQVSTPTRAPGITPQPFTLEFTPTDIHGRAACNYFTGQYQLNPATHTFFVSSVGLTLTACGDTSSYIRDQEFVDLLSAANHYESNWNELRIYADGKQTVLIFEREPFSLSAEQMLRQLGMWLQSLFS